MTKPVLALIPSGYKTSKVYSVLPNNGDGDFTFNRDTSATQVGQNGFIEVSAIDEPRLDYLDGSCPSLMLERVSTNLVTHSEDFSNASWTKARLSVVSNATTSPDGSINADKIVEDATTGQHRLQISAYGSENTRSIYVKYDSVQYIGILTNATDLNFFDIKNGVLGDINVPLSTPTIEALPNGWYRCSLYNPPISDGFKLMLSHDGSTVNYTGDGTSGVFIWGGQFEQQYYNYTLPSSYIPTNGGTVTRTSETCKNAGNAATFNGEEGVLYCEIAAFSNSGIERSISLSDGSGSLANNRIVLSYKATSNRLGVDIVVEGHVPAQFNVLLSDPTTDFHKIAVKWKINDFALWVNGVEVGTDTSTTNRIFADNTLDNLSFTRSDGYDGFYGKTKDLRVFNTALTDAELTELTTI